MAGDWIKIEKELPNKPEVWKVSDILALDPDAVVGKLVRLWSWFDSHLVDGNATSVTKALLDNVTGVTGFVDALITVGWMQLDDDGLTVPNFDRHLSKCSKKRAETNRRVSKHRKKTEKKQECNTESVTEIVTREEKRREDINNKPPPNARECKQDNINNDEIKKQALVETDLPPDKPGVVVCHNGIEKFQMFREWIPDPIKLGMCCMRYGVPREEINEDVIHNHADYFSDRTDMKSEDGWCAKLVSDHKNFTNLQKSKLQGAANASNSKNGFKTARQLEREKNTRLHESLKARVLEHERAEREINTH